MLTIEMRDKRSTRRPTRLFSFHAPAVASTPLAWPIGISPLFPPCEAVEATADWLGADPQCQPRGQGVATIGAVFLKRKDPKRMLDQLRSDITSRLEDLLGEADKLRRALIVLDPRHRAETPATASTPSTQSRRGSGSRPSSGSTTTGPKRTPARASRSTKSKTSTRTPPGATKSAILAALGNGDAMTAGEVATATGIGQATVSTTLSRLAKAGEVTKATRGYQANKSAS